MSASEAKGEYELVATQDQDLERAGSRRAASPAPSSLDRLLHHPALPVLCYCASSILMTVRLLPLLHSSEPALTSPCLPLAGRQQRVVSLPRAPLDPLKQC